MSLPVPIGCAQAFQVTMGILDLIGCARPAGPDMIGCLRLLDMAVMMGQSETNKRDWRKQARLNDTSTDSQTARPAAGHSFFVAGGSDLHTGRLARDF